MSKKSVPPKVDPLDHLCAELASLERRRRQIPRSLHSALAIAHASARQLKADRAAPAVQEVPLSDVTITWKRARVEFEGEDKTVTFTGAQLGPMLKWMSYAKHMTLVNPGDLLEARLNLSGVTDILLALSQVNLPSVPIDADAIFHLLSRVTEDAKAMIAVAEDDAMPNVTITIGRPAAVDAEKKVAA